jgi:hypothetical protein
LQDLRVARSDRTGASNEKWKLPLMVVFATTFELKQEIPARGASIWLFRIPPDG